MSASTQSMAAKHEQGMMTSASAHDEGVDVDQLEAEYAGMLAGVRGVYRSGKTQSAAWRIAQLKQLRRGMVECKDEIVAAMAADLGRSKFEATMLEVASVLGEIDFLVANVETWMAPTRVSHPLAVQPGSSYIYTEPKGVVLVLAPWNYPTNLAIMGVAGALVAGNCVVLKPSEVCTASAIVTEKIITKYLDNECVKVVQGAVPETTALLRLRWDHILYTGNGGVGRIVATAAAKHLTPVTLELGGKSPCIVDGSAKIATAAKRIMNTKLLNCGQTCVAPDYVLATDSTLDKLIPALTSTVESFFGSDPMASDSFARIVNHRHFDRIMRLIDPSSHGGQVLCGGPDLADRDSKYIPPTIILNPRLDSPLMTEEIFGCVLPICTVGSMQEAIDFTRDRETPLALYGEAAPFVVAGRLRFPTNLTNHPCPHVANLNPNSLRRGPGRHRHRPRRHRVGRGHGQRLRLPRKCFGLCLPIGKVARKTHVA